jgi:hypothetical protein
MEATGYARWFERDLRQLLWHRHRLVQMRTRIMNQLHALAMNEAYRRKKKLFSEQGRVVLEKLSLAPRASRRRQELLELSGERSFGARPFGSHSSPAVMGVQVLKS